MQFLAGHQTADNGALAATGGSTEDNDLAHDSDIQ